MTPLDFDDPTRPGALSPEEYEWERMNAKTLEVPILTQEQIIASMRRERNKETR